MIGLPITEQYGEETGPMVTPFEAAFELASMDTFVSGFARNTALDELDGPTSTKLAPEVLNEKYPFVQTPFKKPMSEVAAFHLNEEGKKRRALEEAITKGSSSSLYSAAVGLGAGIVAHALDPVEFGVGAATGMLLSGAGTLVAASSSRSIYGGVRQGAKLLARQGTTAGEKFAFQATEGIIGNAALEPFIADQSTRAMIDYDLQDSLVSVIGGGIAAPTAIYGLSKTFGGLFNKSKTASKIAIETAIGQTKADIAPNVDLVNKAYDDYIFKAPPREAKVGEVRSGYKFTPLDVSQKQEITLYSAGRKEDGRMIGEFFGEGVYTSDNPNFINNLAAHPMEEFPTDVIELKISEANLLDYKAPNKDLLLDLASTVEDKNIKKILSSSEYFEQAWSTIRKRADSDLGDEQIKGLMKEVKARGFDGISISDSNLGHNAIHIFPEAEAKLSESAKWSPDMNSIPKLNEAELAQATSDLMKPSSKIGFDPEIEKLKDFQLGPEVRALEVDHLKNNVDSLIQSMDDLKTNNLLDTSTIKELESVKAKTKAITSIPEIIEDFANCLLSGAD